MTALARGSAAFSLSGVPASRPSSSFPRYRPLGEHVVVVQLGDELSLEGNAKVRALARLVEERGVPGVRQLIPVQTSLAVRFDPMRADFAQVVDALRALEGELEAAEPAQGKTVTIPVVYGGPYGEDLEEVAARTGLSPEEVIRRHEGRPYTVYMVGFSAGLPYVGDIDERLWLPRRPTPRLQVPAGSIGIAMKQTIVYTVESPGGWHLIGRTPMRTFDPHRDPPGLVVAGDTVVFKAIDPADAEGWDEERQREWDRRWNL